MSANSPLIAQALANLIRSSNLQGSDWPDLLDEWRGRVDWNQSHPKINGRSLLEMWPRHGIPVSAALWLLNEYGNGGDFWNTPERSSLRACVTISVQSAGNDPQPGSAEILLSIQPSALAAATADLIGSERQIFSGLTSKGIDVEALLGTNLLAPALASRSLSAERAERFFRENPTALTATASGQNAGSVLINHEAAFEGYLAAGGSLFTPTGPSGDPLWRWALANQKASPSFLEALSSVANHVALSMDEDKNPGTLLSDADFNQAIAQRRDIEKFSRAAKIEKRVCSQYEGPKAVMKKTPEWRSWRSIRGENIMHACSAKELPDAVSKMQFKINNAMLAEKTPSGLGFPFYFLVGGLAFSPSGNTTRRHKARQSLAKNLQDREASILAHPVPDVSPFLQVARANTSDTFGAINFDDLKAPSDFEVMDSLIHSSFRKHLFGGFGPFLDEILALPFDRLARVSGTASRLLQTETNPALAIAGLTVEQPADTWMSALTSRQKIGLALLSMATYQSRSYSRFSPSRVMESLIRPALADPELSISREEAENIVKTAAATNSSALSDLASFASRIVLTAMTQPSAPSTRQRAM